jgi:hypothetical protein
MTEETTTDDAIDYCYEHVIRFIKDMNDMGIDGAEQFHGLIDLLESGKISPIDLKDYGMNY